jgi:NTE family protein
VHNLSEKQPLAPLGVGVDLNTDLSFFERLFAIGRAAADRWLGDHFEALGVRSTVDLPAMFRAQPTADEAKPLR